MLGRHRTQHGREEQHRQNGGASLHHGAGQTCTFTLLIGGKAAIAVPG